MSKFVTYVRVSTQKQGQSGLGLEAQRASVLAYTDPSTIIAEYIEVESGKKNDRPMLIKALAHAKAEGAVLLIAKLDRLSRNLHFISGLLESGVEIKAVDMPSASRMVLQIVGVMAEEEARMISVRTKAALQAAKERGTKLGSNNPTIKASILARGQASADQSFKDIQSIEGYQNLSINGLAKAMNDAGFKTVRGNAYTPMGIKRILDRQ